MNSLPVRKEVQDFILVSETLLSPALLSSALTPEECEIIAEYIMSLSHLKHPWSKSQHCGTPKVTSSTAAPMIFLEASLG